MFLCYSWLCAQESLLAVLWGPYILLGLESGSAMCKSITQPVVLALQPLGHILKLLLHLGDWFSGNFLGF